MHPEDQRILNFLSEALQPGVAINRIGYVQIDGALVHISERLAKLEKLERQIRDEPGNIERGKKAADIAD